MQMTLEQIEEIDAELQVGDTPEQVAIRRGLSYGQLRYALLSVGKQIVMYRRLEDTAPVDARELTQAA